MQISRGSYTNYEIGARGIPAEVLIKLADYYNVSIDYLVGRTKNPKRNK
ncbi:XRE family transcriptional regulator [Subdoligranulum sp. AM16-9]|nr:XRE family transcriptional regulator [Subdoligranulum sp. AM16-9]